MKKKRTKGCLVSIIALGVLAICLIAGLIWVGIQEYQDMPRLVSGIDFGSYSPDAYTYSQEQQTVIAEHGNPQSFTILFYHQQDPDGKKVYVRYEVWDYPTLGKSLIFENGYPVAENSIEPYAAIPTNYQPASFTAFMRREALATAADIDEWFILPVEEELLYDADLYYADGLTFGLQADELVYIEALGFEDPNAPAVVLPEEPSDEPAVVPEVSFTPEMEASLGLYDYSIIVYQDGSVVECGSIPVEANFEGDLLHLNEAGELKELTRIEENIYAGEIESIPITLSLTQTGYYWWAEEDDVIYEFFAIRELSDDLQILSTPGLSEEETRNQGTHTYRADFCENGEVYDTYQIMMTNTFTENTVENVESAGLDIYLKLGTNLYMDDEKPDFEMIFTDIGFIWRIKEDQGFSFVIFTIQ
ncbi:MAG: hypothetical protein JW757_10025 [Anaerolineales bacterium]|nr:hypothetical protein [Anaerolineales bacterium]